MHCDWHALQMVEGLKVTTDKKAAANQIKALYKLFVEKDCTMLEVSGECTSCQGRSCASSQPCCNCLHASCA
jgi:hypothetical protein